MNEQTSPTRRNTTFSVDDSNFSPKTCWQNHRNKAIGLIFLGAVPTFFYFASTTTSETTRIFCDLGAGGSLVLTGLGFLPQTTMDKILQIFNRNALLVLWGLSQGMYNTIPGSAAAQGLNHALTTESGILLAGQGYFAWQSRQAEMNEQTVGYMMLPADKKIRLSLETGSNTERKIAFVAQSLLGGGCILASYLTAQNAISNFLLNFGLIVEGFALGAGSIQLLFERLKNLAATRSDNSSAFQTLNEETLLNDLKRAINFFTRGAWPFFSLLNNHISYPLSGLFLGAAKVTSWHHFIEEPSPANVAEYQSMNRYQNWFALLTHAGFFTWAVIAALTSSAGSDGIAAVSMFLLGLWSGHLLGHFINRNFNPGQNPPPFNTLRYYTNEYPDLLTFATLEWVNTGIDDETIATDDSLGVTSACGAWLLYGFMFGLEVFGRQYPRRRGMSPTAFALCANALLGRFV